MARINTVNSELRLCRAEGYPISEKALRAWLRQGVIPSVSIGNRRLVLHDNVIAFLRCEKNWGCL